jgi:hypothetical protein
MRTHLRSNAIAYLALFVALGGTSFAATRLPANSVGTKQLKKGAVVSSKLHADAVTSASVKAGSLLASDFAIGQLPDSTAILQDDGGFQQPGTMQVPIKQVQVTMRRAGHIVIVDGLVRGGTYDCLAASPCTLSYPQILVDGAPAPGTLVNAPNSIPPMTSGYVIADAQMPPSVVAVAAGTHTVKIGYMVGSGPGSGGLTAPSARLLIVTTG